MKFQSWFKRNRKIDRKHNHEVARGDITDLLHTLQKTDSAIQLHPTPTRPRQTLVEEELPRDKSAKEALPSLKAKSHLTPAVWSRPLLILGVPYFPTKCPTSAFPALASALEMPPTIALNVSPKKKETVQNSFTPELTEPSSLKTNIRIRDPFEDDPTPTKKRKLSSDVTYQIQPIDKTVEEIYHLTSPPLPHVDNFLWGIEEPRCT